MNSSRQRPPGQDEQCAEDARLMAAVAEGSTEAFGQLYDRHAAVAYPLLLKILRQQGDAEVVLSEVFWEIWRDAAHFDPSRGRFRTYLLTKARSRALDFLRKEVNRRKLVDAVAANTTATGAMAPPDAVACEEDRELVRGALGELSEEKREPIRLAYFEGLTHIEIAERLQLPLGTIKTRLRTALKELRGKLRARGGNDAMP